MTAVAPGRVEQVLRVGINVIVGSIGGIVGFHHTQEWAVENWQGGLAAWGVAVVVEAMAVVAGFELRRSPGVFPAVVLVVSFLVQMTAQVSQARPTAAGWLLAATPALGFLVIVKLALRAGKSSRATQAMTLPVVPVTADRVGQSTASNEPVVVGLPAAEPPARPVGSVWPPGQ